MPYQAERSTIKILEEILIKLREFMEFHLEARYPDVTTHFIRNAQEGILLRN